MMKKIMDDDDGDDHDGGGDDDNGDDDDNVDDDNNGDDHTWAVRQCTILSCSALLSTMDIIIAIIHWYIHDIYLNST